MQKDDLQALRRSLIERQAALRASIESTEEDRKPVEVDQASVGRLSRMDAIQAQAMALAAKRMRTQEMARIDATIKRIDTGAYGFCVVCDEEIGAQRLAVDPTIPTCITCASKSK